MVTGITPTLTFPAEVHLAVLDSCRYTPQEARVQCFLTLLGSPISLRRMLILRLWL